jgi:hypothetical protein
MEGGWGENRKDMEFGKDPAFQSYFTRLANIRTGSIALRRGAYQELHVDHDVLAYARCHPSQTVVVALNNGGGANSRDLPVPKAIADGTVLTDQLNGGQYTVKDGKIHVDLGAREAVILS